MSEITATWHISLDCDCPNCDEYVNLLEYDDFSADIDIELGDCERDVKVTCPKCGHEFVVDFEY